MSRQRLATDGVRAADRPVPQGGQVQRRLLPPRLAHRGDGDGDGEEVTPPHPGFRGPGAEVGLSRTVGAAPPWALFKDNRCLLLNKAQGGVAHNVRRRAHAATEPRNPGWIGRRLLPPRLARRGDGDGQRTVAANCQLACCQHAGWQLAATKEARAWHKEEIGHATVLPELVIADVAELNWRNLVGCAMRRCCTGQVLASPLARCSVYKPHDGFACNLWQLG